MKDTIYCNVCKKEIDLHEDTRPKKNERWDLICLYCENWLGSMKDLLNWEINEDKNS